MKIKLFLMFGILFLLLASFSSATYTRSSVQSSQFGGSSTTFEKAVCQAGQDFLVQIAPLGCTPAVVRSDLLEENDVPIFCKLAATKINPLIEVEAIDSISFSGKYSKEISGIAFHPAKSALGVKDQLNNPVLENIGYVVIALKKQANVSAIPDSISGELTAKIKYNIKNAFGVGNALFYLDELSDEDWAERKYQSSFWGGKGALRADSIEDNSAQISVYSKDNKISSVNLEKGETSNMIYLPGFECQAGLKLKLVDMENPGTRARLLVDSEVVEVGVDEKFLDNNCQVKVIDHKGLAQKVTLRCQEDNKANLFNLIVSPRVILNIDGENRIVKLGDFLYDNGKESVYLGYVGTKKNSNAKENLVIYLFSTPQSRSETMSDAKLTSINSIASKFIGFEERPRGVITEDVLAGLRGGGAALTGLSNWIAKGESLQELEFADKTKTIFGKKISIADFADAQDRILEGSVKENYENAAKDYESVISQFPSESFTENTDTTFGEEALYNKILLAFNAGQKKTAYDLCNDFIASYPNSDKNFQDYCGNKYKLSSLDESSAYVSINKKIVQISLDNIYEPTFEEYGATIIVRNAGEYSGDYSLQKGEIIQISAKETFSMTQIKDNSVMLDIKNIDDGLISFKSGAATVGLNEYIVVGKNKYQITVTKINLKKSAKVSVLSNINNAGTEANFSFNIAIEKRAIELPPEKVKSMIDSLNKEIAEWESLSKSLGTVVEGLKTACLITGGALTLKNFAANTGGEGIARQKVMKESGGWSEKCAEMVAKKVYPSKEKCYLENAGKIDSDVTELANLMEAQNNQIKQLESGLKTSQFLSETTVNTDEFMKKYSPQVQKSVEALPSEYFSDPKKLSSSLDKGEMVATLSYEGWKKNFYSVEQLRDVESYISIINDNGASGELKSFARSNLYSEFYSIKTASANYAEISSWANDLKVSSDKVLSVETNEKVKKLAYDGLTNKDIGNKISGEGINENTPVALVQTFPEGKKYIIALDNSGGTSRLSIKVISQKKLAIFESDGRLAEFPPSGLTNVYFEKYDSSSYKNNYKNAKLRYYETEPYKGMPAIVPFDLNNGWYAATKPTVAVGNNVKSYESSGRVSSFYVCNVGQNGLEEFQTIGDDICQMINTGTGQTYNNFPGLSPEDASKIISKANQAIEEASKIPESSRSGKVKILNQIVDVGTPAVNSQEYECQDLMSPKECLLLFNVCDPVICPSSRCDLGGAYPVQDVIQSGIIGSIVLCLPNIQEGIVMPVCLTGIKAGIDGFLSVKTSYRDCLNESLNSGKLVGICDEIYSIYICDFFLRQALPLADMAIPKIMEALLGQNARGGGEYLGVSNAWDTAKKSLDYFSQSYGSGSSKAFLARTTEEIGGEICKAYTSAVYPSSGDLLDTLTGSDSPVQFTARFQEIPMSSATVPPISHYKVYYHIYSGKDSGTYYQVYLKGSSESSYYQDTASSVMVASGYITVDSYASETKDFTATSGYSELCVNVNGEETCDFKEVSTSFALNYIEDKYLQSQAGDTQVTKTSDCISGTASAYSLLNPNLQASAEEAINPVLYQEGIIRICATDNPGKGTDVNIGTNNSRWQDVGYCDDEKMRCWLDITSVDNAIKSTTIKNETLSEVSENYLKLLREEGNYISEEEFSSKIKEIKLEKDPAKKINLINAIKDKVFWNGEKAYLFYLRGNAYSDILKSLVPSVKTTVTLDESQKIDSTAEKISTDSKKMGETIWKTAKAFADQQWDEHRSCAGEEEEGTVKCEYDDVCARFVVRVLIIAGIRTPEILLASTEKNGEIVFDDNYRGWKTKYNLESNVDLIKALNDNSNFKEVSSSELVKGDIVFLGYGANKFQHASIFDSYSFFHDKINVYGEPGVFNYQNNPPRPAQLQKGIPITSSEWYFYRAFRYVGEEAIPENVAAESLSSSQTEAGKKLLEIVNSGYSTTYNADVQAGTGVSSLGCLVLLQSIQESSIRHCKDKSISCGDNLNSNEVSSILSAGVISGDNDNSFGIMQVNLPSHKTSLESKGFYVGRFEDNVKYAADYLVNRMNYCKNKNGAVSWKEALTAYNSGSNCVADSEYTSHIFTQERLQTLKTYFPECSVDESSEVSTTDNSAETKLTYQKIYDYAASVGSKQNPCSSVSDATFVSDALINSEIDGITSTSSLASLVSQLEQNPNFVEISLSSASNLQKGDILLLGTGCNKDFSTGIFSSYQNSKISFYSHLNFGSSPNCIQLENYKFTRQIYDDVYVYRAFRYAGDLTDKGVLDSRKKWTLASSYEHVKPLIGSYTKYKLFADQLVFDGLLNKEECDDMNGGFLGIGEENMNWLANLLKSKLDAQGSSPETEETTEPVKIVPWTQTKINSVINGEIALDSVKYQGQLFCALYSRELAEKVFGYKYYQADVWCREAVGDKLIWKTPSMETVYQMTDLTSIREENEKKLIELESKGTLKPGMILGVYFPQTSSGIIYGKDIACTDKNGVGFYISPGVPIIVKPYYTHNLLYLGKNKNNEMVFAELFYDSPSLRTLTQFKDSGFVVMAVFAPPDSLNK